MKRGDYADWKRDGVAGTYLVEVLAVKDGRVKIRPIRHNWYPDRHVSERARWVGLDRLDPTREKP